MVGSEKRVGVGVIGAGMRSLEVVKNLLRDSERNVEIRAIYDPDKHQAERARESWKSPGAAILDNFKDVSTTNGVSWVMVFSPNAYHCEHVVAAFEAGCDVFAEKPLATSIEDCVSIHDAHQASGRQFATGFVLRYAPLYRRLRQLIDDGVLGDIIAIDANENIAPDHGSYIMTNWRRHTALAGPHILEKCCHDLDILNWLVGSVPMRVAAFGGRDFFVPENSEMLDRYGKECFLSWEDPHREPDASPFTSESDLMDNIVSVLEYKNGVRVQFQATMSNAIPERRMYVSGSEGTAIAELYSGTLSYQRIGDNERTEVSWQGADGHGGGDDFIMKELYDVMVTGSSPKCSGEEGLLSAVVAMAIDEAAREGCVVDLAPTWLSLGTD